MVNKELTVNEIERIQLNILVSVDDFCRNNGIRYFLAYGTLIGAIRHKGYIPWDDDIDIAMPRPDYQRFIQLYNKQKGEETYVVYPEQDSAYPYAFAKICDSKSYLIEYSSLNYDLGVNIDLFPIDGLPEDDRKAKSHYSKISFLRNCLIIKKIKIDFKRRSVPKNLYLMFFKGLLLPISYKLLIIKKENLSLKYNYSDSIYAADLNFGDFNRRLSKNNFEQNIPIVFEGHQFYAPVGYDQWLKTIYGSYMDLPPIEKQISHHAFKAYRK